jgi:hypothetical protein
LAWRTRTTRADEAIMRLLRCLSLIAAYAIALLLSAVWVLGALVSLRQPLADLGKARVGDAIIGFANCLALSPEQTLRFAHMLAGMKLLLGAFLLTAFMVAVWEWMRRRGEGDAMLEVGLFMSAVASIVAGIPTMDESRALQGMIGELMLCSLASGLTAYGRGARPTMPISAAGSPALYPHIHAAARYWTGAPHRGW